jgi:hypothetical protein
MAAPSAAPVYAEIAPPGWYTRAKNYLENDILPGVYKLPETFEFKWVLAGFMAIFIMVVTSLSVVPLIRLLKVNIEEQSQQHALTIATTLAKVNRPALSQNMESAVSVEMATSRPGVRKAYIIQQLDGNIIAPANQAGLYPDIPYVHEGRKLTKESVKQIDDTVIAMVPIEEYNPETGVQAIKAWAVVFYDMGSMAIDSAQVLSLYISTLFIALLVGSLVFFFLYKMIEFPFKSMNQQLDVALKEGRDTITVTYQFPALQTLASNVSSALNRALNGGGGGGPAMEHDRNREIANLVELIGFAAVGVHAHDLSLGAVNQAFEQRASITSAQAAAMTVNDIMDQALKLSIKDLIERVDQSPDALASNDLEFSGQDFQVVAQAIYGTSKIAYYLIVLLPMGEPE